MAVNDLVVLPLLEGEEIHIGRASCLIDVKVLGVPTIHLILGPPLPLLPLQLGQSNGSVTDGPAECDNRPSTTGQRTRPTFHEFGVRNDWAEILKSAMRHGCAAGKRAPHTMGQPILAADDGTHTLRPLASLASPNLYILYC